MTFSNILSELKNAYGTVQSIATKLNIQLPTQFPTQVVKLKECLEVYNTCKTGIATVVMDARQEFSLESLAKLTTDIDKNWDKFAKEYNDLFNSSTSAQQANVLETFAKTHFGDKVFNTGSVIKNETPNILNGILTFQSGIDSFKGSYRNPHEAANKIRQGVDNIVGATEQVAQSLNQIYKLIKGKGTLNNVPGHPVLDALSDLHKNKVVATGIGITHTAADGFEVLDEGKQLADAVKAGDLKGTIAAGEAFTDAVKKVIKDINGITQQQPSSPNSSNIKASSNDQNSNTNNSKNRQQEKDKEKENKGKADSYVCSGATLKCSFGDKNSKLSVYPDRTVFLTERPMANISDHTSMYNIWPFGKCRTVSYPSTGSATAAAHGKLTPMPCIPGTVTEWLNGKSDYIIKGKPALLKSSYCRCQWGGIITIIDDGQVDTGYADLSKENKETETDWKEKDQEKLLENTDTLLDGIQMALDFAGFIPGIGVIADLTNAAIYATRGDKINAGLSLLAAIPGIGDAAAAAKIAGKGIKAAKVLNKNVKNKKALTILAKEEKKIIAKKYVNKNVSKGDLLKEKGVTSDNVDEVYRQIKIERKREAINFYKEQWKAEKKTNKLIINPSEEDFKKALVYDTKESIKDTKEKRRAIINHINGIDFNYPVERVNISKNTVLYQYNSGKFGNYFTPDSKATPNHLGISSYANGTLREKFEITFNDIPQAGLPALKSTAKTISDTWSTKLYSPHDMYGKPSIVIGEQTLGGGTQIFIPHNISNLDVKIRPLSIIISK